MVNLQEPVMVSHKAACWATCRFQFSYSVYDVLPHKRRPDPPKNPRLNLSRVEERHHNNVSVFKIQRSLRFVSYLDVQITKPLIGIPAKRPDTSV